MRQDKVNSRPGNTPSTPCFPALSTLVLKTRDGLEMITSADLIAFVRRVRGQGGMLEGLILEHVQVDGELVLATTVLLRRFKPTGTEPLLSEHRSANATTVLDGELVGLHGIAETVIRR